jgi:hypothetical protein
LFATKKEAEEVNKQELAKLPNKPQVFVSQDQEIVPGKLKE